MPTANKPTSTRRTTLTTSLAGLLAGIAAPALASGTNPDAELIALARRVFENDTETDRISEEIDRLPLNTPAERRLKDQRWTKEMRPLVDESWNLRSRLAELPATTMAGFRAKAAIVQQYNNCSPGYAHSCQDDALAWSLANDLLGVASVWRADDGEASS